MDSALRPRDIQARIRAGESPEDVAAAAQTSVEAIMPFADPVLAERAHVARTAQKASVRRRAEIAGTARTLGDSAGLFFSGHSLHDEDVAWDAWRQADGRWALVAEYVVDSSPRRAEFTHDLPGKYVVAENDEARLLTGELREPGEAGSRIAEQRRRLSAVPDQDELPLGDDAIELVRDQPERAEDDVVEDVIAEEVEAPEAEEPELDAPEAEEPPAEEQPARTARSKRKGRSSIPSWDEIMFGGQSE